MALLASSATALARSAESFAAQVVLQPRSVGDVLDQDQNTIKRPVVFPHALCRKAAVEYLAVLADEPLVRDVALGDSFQHPLEMGLLAGQVIGMDQFGPGLEHQFLFRIPQHLAQSMVGLDPVLVRRQHRHTHQSLLKIPAEPLLAFEQASFGPLAVGDFLLQPAVGLRQFGTCGLGSATARVERFAQQGHNDSHEDIQAEADLMFQIVDQK